MPWEYAIYLALLRCLKISKMVSNVKTNVVIFHSLCARKNVATCSGSYNRKSSRHFVVIEIALLYQIDKIGFSFLQAVENMCSHKMSAQLYDQLKVSAVL